MMKKSFTIIGAIVAWFAVLLQLYLIIENRTASVGETILRFFSFFTVLTNIIVAVFFSRIIIRNFREGASFFVCTAITVYITIVGLIYNLILRSLWSPTGWQKLADELLHVVVPLLMIIYWSVFTVKNKIPWRKLFSLLIYPAVYLIFILIRGGFSGFYPYPFVNVNDLGYETVAVNCVGMLGVFVLVGIVFVGIGNSSSHQKLP